MYMSEYTHMYMFISIYIYRLYPNCIQCIYISGIQYLNLVGLCPRLRARSWPFLGYRTFIC